MKYLFLLDANNLLYLLFIGCFVVFVLFAIIYNGIDGLVSRESFSSNDYNRQYTIQQNTWDHLNDITIYYEGLLKKCQEDYPIVWKIGRIRTSSYINSPVISINQSSQLPNVYLDIVFPPPMNGAKGQPGAPGDKGSDGNSGEVGAMGEKGMLCPL